MSKYEIATNYAKALYDTSKESGNAEKNLHQLFELQKASKTLQEDVRFSEQEAEDFVSQFAFTDELKQLLKIMAQNNRIRLLPTIHEEFQALLDKDMNVVRGEITSADVLNNEQKKIIEDYVNQVTGKKSILSYKEDDSILGGFTVNVGSMKLDGSIRNQINKIKNMINNGEH